MVHSIPLSKPIIQYIPLSDTIYIIMNIMLVFQWRITFEFLIDKLCERKSGHGMCSWHEDEIIVSRDYGVIEIKSIREYYLELLHEPTQLVVCSTGQDTFWNDCEE